MVSGVAQVQVYGSQKYAVRIQLDPKALATRGIGIDEVSTAIQNANVNMPTGTLYGHHQAFTVDTKGQLTNAAAYRSLIVAYQNGSPVRLEDVGRVIDSVQNDKTAGWSNGERSVVLAIQRQPGTNTVQVVDNVLRLLPAFQAEVPAALHIHILGNYAETIRASINDVQVHAAAHHLPGRDGDLHVPAQPVGDDHPEPGAADVDSRHLRRDVDAGLLARQPVADGDHARRRLRGGRRDRHAREHRAPHGDGQGRR